MSTLIGQRIRELRLKSGLTQTQLAKGIVTPSMISQIEAGKAHPSPALLRNLAKRLEAPENVLLETPQSDESTLAGLDVIHACVDFGLYEEAEALINEALRYSQNHFILHDLRGKVLLAQRKLPEAAKAFEQAMAVAIEQIKLDSVAELYQLQGDVHMEEGSHEIAAHLYELALLAVKEHAPLNGLLEAEIMLRLSRAYAGLRRDDEAKQLAAQAEERMALSKRSKETAREQVRESVTCLKRGDILEARRLSLEARSLQKVFRWLESSVETMLIVAQQRIDEAQFSKALEQLDQISLQSHEYLDEKLTARMLFLRGQALFGLGKHQEAVESVAAGLSYSSKANIEAAHATLRASHAAYEAGEVASALQLAQTACEIGSSLQDLVLLSSACTWLAHVRYETEDYAGAKSALSMIDNVTSLQKEDKSRVSKA